MIKELRAFPDAVAVDPRNCGCTECLIGEYVNLGEDSANDFVRRAKESLESEFSAIDTERLISLSL